MNKINDKEFQLYRLTSNDDKYIIADFKAIQDLQNNQWYLIDTSRPLLAWLLPYPGKLKFRVYLVTKELIESQFNIYDHTLTAIENQKLAISGRKQFSILYPASVLLLALIHLMARSEYIANISIPILFFSIIGFFLVLLANFSRRLMMNSKLKKMNLNGNSLFLSKNVEFKHLTLNIITIIYLITCVLGNFVTNSEYSKSFWYSTMAVMFVTAIVGYVMGQDRFAPKDRHAEEKYPLLRSKRFKKVIGRILND